MSNKNKSRKAPSKFILSLKAKKVESAILPPKQTEVVPQFDVPVIHPYSTPLPSIHLDPKPTDIPAVRILASNRNLKFYQNTIVHSGPGIISHGNKVEFKENKIIVGKNQSGIINFGDDPTFDSNEIEN